MKKQRKISQLRLMIILVIGGFGFLGVYVFGHYVNSLSDLPSGPTPLSWKFKSNANLVEQTFNQGGPQMNNAPVDSDFVPPIDKVDYPVTETALFALG